MERLFCLEQTKITLFVSLSTPLLNLGNPEVLALGVKLF